MVDRHRYCALRLEFEYRQAANQAEFSRAEMSVLEEACVCIAQTEPEYPLTLNTTVSVSKMASIRLMRRASEQRKAVHSR